MYLVYAKEGKKETIVISSAQAWRPSMYEGAHSSFCTTHYCPGRHHYKYASVAYRSPPTCVTILLRTVEGLVSSRGEGRLRTVPSPVFGFIQRWGRLCTVPCVWVYVVGSGFTVPCVAVLYNRAGAALYRPLCSISYITGGGSSTVPCVWFYIAFRMALRGGDGVTRGQCQIPPPPVGMVEVE